MVRSRVELIEEVTNLLAGDYTLVNRSQHLFDFFTDLLDSLATGEIVGSSLPDQEGAANKYLKTDGENASWQTVGIAVPGLQDVTGVENSTADSIELDKNIPAVNGVGSSESPDLFLKTNIWRAGANTSVGYKLRVKGNADYGLNRFCILNEYNTLVFAIGQHSGLIQCTTLVIYCPDGVNVMSPTMFSGGQVVVGGSGLWPWVPSALLEVRSTIQGFLPPRMTTAQKIAIASPAVGLMVYDTNLDVLCVYNLSGWKQITVT